LVVIVVGVLADAVLDAAALDLFSW
jgi:hypothetical protein